jgi:hypothetical protein
MYGGSVGHASFSLMTFLRLSFDGASQMRNADTLLGVLSMPQNCGAPRLQPARQRRAK